MATAVHLGPAAMDWLLVDAQGQEVCKRQSWDSSQALISLDASCCCIKVKLGARVLGGRSAACAPALDAASVGHAKARCVKRHS